MIALAVESALTILIVCSIMTGVLSTAFFMYLHNIGYKPKGMQYFVLGCIIIPLITCIYFTIINI